MEPISLILAALAAGATAAAKDTAGTAVKDAYESLKALIKKRFAGDTLAQAMIDAKPDEIKQAEGLLTNKITNSGVDKDEEVLQAAQMLLKQLKSEAVAKGESYQLNVGGNFTGVARDVDTGGGDATLTFGKN
ncbi:MAG: hypothetical protein EWV82_13390 [Microcystis aeruginosa Ma_AC_P_19900807_S299]|jgi:disulfide oxidoreductase YuzD|nr:MAG: hypothetical protein EWV82_13390 [Microcystis aeruginosa Ma_AC_P_19900807_S299]